MDFPTGLPLTLIARSVDYRFQYSNNEGGNFHLDIPEVYGPGMDSTAVLQAVEALAEVLLTAAHNSAAGPVHSVTRQFYGTAGADQETVTYP